MRPRAVILLRFVFALPPMFTGCAAEPARITFDGEPTVTVHALDELPVPRAVVLDAEGQPILPAPTLTWTITPATVATLARGRVVPVGNGRATVEARRGAAVGTYTVVVALPDRLVLGGHDPAAPWVVGEARALTAVVMAGEHVVPDRPVRWAAANPNVIAVGEGGRATALLPGSTTLTATSGELTATLEVTVVDATPG